MPTKSFFSLLGSLTLATLVGCGGGGGSAGTPATGPGSAAGGVPGISSGTTAVASLAIDVLSGSGASTRSISAIEISKVSVVLKDAAGKFVPGVVVTFSEKGGSLLTISPASKTALTDAAGVASVEIRGASSAMVGATTISASAVVVTAAVTAEVAIAVTSAPTGGAIIAEDIVNALNFLDVNPPDKSIVLAGSGGNGRSESATLRFRAVDKNNTPVKGAKVSFVVVPANDVTLNIRDGVSDADGVVATTVSSKTTATAVVVRATVVRTGAADITSQSDKLLVTTGTAVPASFDLSATKYNLNSGITGDKAVITVRVADANRNPVANGVPVVFTADFGAVGSSSQGGCTTLEGACSVDYIVQNPRPNDGQLATVTASARVGDGTPISGTLKFRLVQPSLLELFAAPSGAGAPSFALNCGKSTVSAFAGTPAAFPAPDGTLVSVKPITSDFTATLKNGSPVLDQLSQIPQRTRVDLEFDLTNITGVKACAQTGSRTETAEFEVKFTVGNIVQSRVLQVSYRAAP